MTEENIVDDAKALAEEAKKPGVFNILEVLKERGLPKDVVSIILDDETAYAAAKLKERIDELMNSDTAEDITVEVNKLQAELEPLVKKLNENRYQVYITAISEGAREKLVAQAVEKFPYEYDEEKNPFTGEAKKTEKPSPEREEFFTDLLWVDSIEKIVSPDGAEQALIDLEFVKQFRELISVPTNASITQAIEKLRVATAMFIMSTDEDFLAKP